MHTCNKNYKFSGIEIPFLCCNRVHDIWKGVVKTFLNLRRKGVVILHDFVIHLLKSCSVLCVQLDGFCKAHCLAWFDLRWTPKLWHNKSYHSDFIFLVTLLLFKIYLYFIIYICIVNNSYLYHTIWSAWTLQLLMRFLKIYVQSLKRI